LLLTTFILATIIVAYIGYNEVFAQLTGNQSTASNAAGPLTPYSPGPHSNHSNSSINTPFNQSKLIPNNTETIKSFDKLNGNNSQFFLQRIILQVTLITT
jgi:hypothetical protein